MDYTVAALYRFVIIDDPAQFKRQVEDAVRGHGILGTLLIAGEGINGTLAGSAGSIDHFLQILGTLTGLPRCDVKFSSAPEKPFGKLKIRIKREIITFNQPGIDPSKMAGTYVEPQNWNELISDPDVLLIDTRNHYETTLGTFAGAHDPNIIHFSEFPQYVRTTLNAEKHRKVAMFCTGGIRCEKASSFMLQEGFSEVYHLKGGILKYLETVPETESAWHGECYVFDRRMAVGHGLTTGRYSMCFSCGIALDEDAKQHPDFEDGVSCAACRDLTSEDDKRRFRDRHRQITGSRQSGSSQDV